MAGTVSTLTVKAGDPVTAGQVLATIDPADAQSEVDDAQTAVTDAEQRLADARAAAAAAASPTPSAGSTRAAPPGGTSRTNANSTSRASTGTDAVYTATVQLNNARLALLQARRKLAGCTITAPIAGTVLAVNGSVGATEDPGGTAFLTVGSVADTQVKAQFSEADVARVTVGQPATITVKNQAGTLTGKVSSVDPAGTASNNLVRYTVMIGFDQPPTGLLYGQSANVTVTTASADNVLYLPTSAVRDVHDGTGTVTVRAGGRGAPRTVRVGLRGDRYTEITSGLAEGEQVVIDNG
jgi:HlyD family secretion protein